MKRLLTSSLLLVACAPTDPIQNVEKVYSTTCQLKGSPLDPPKVKLTRYFKQAMLDAPIQMLPANDGSGRIFFVSQMGQIYVAPAATEMASATLWLNINDRVAGRDEMGLLSMAFDPDFSKNGRFYVNYTPNKTGAVRTVVSRFRVPAPPMGQPDPKSEQILLNISQPYENHNGGQIDFGPDGYLYVGMGDGGAGGDPVNAGQRMDTLLGKMLRIDVRDGEASYKIPADNPFFTGQAKANGLGADNSHCKDSMGKPGTCGETWALGFRNPWRFTFDPLDGSLWTGDVGQGTREEIDVVLRGKNYGWRCMEGFEIHLDDAGCKAKRAAKAFTEPVHDYPRSDGTSVTGGHVYRGKLLPGLYGSYLFGDFEKGTLWALSQGKEGKWVRTTLAENVGKISAFGVDDKGEVYVVDYVGRQFLRIEPAQAGQGGNMTPGWPQKISETGCFADVSQKTLVPGALHYSVNVPLWSDGAEKARAVVLPKDTQLGYKETGTWEIPNGTVFLKTFTLSGTFLETRFLVKNEEGIAGATYRWNQEGTEAYLLSSAASTTVAGQEWTFPSRGDCQSCHTKAAGHILGLTTAQMNRSYDVFRTGDTPQIDALSRLGYLRGVPSAQSALPKAPPPEDASAPLSARARAYLQSNCANCHLPGGLGNVSIDLREQTSLSQGKACNQKAQHGDVGVKDALILAPKMPQASTLYLRMATPDRMWRMPQIGTAIVDPVGSALVKEWISQLPSCD